MCAIARVQLCAGEVQARPAYHNGVVFFAVEESKTVLAMNATTGDVIWSYSGALEEFNGSPSVSAAGIVYAGSNDRCRAPLAAAAGVPPCAVPRAKCMFAADDIVPCSGCAKCTFAGCAAFGFGAVFIFFCLCTAAA